MSTTQQGRMMSISTPLGEDFLLINKLSAAEELSALFRYEVELLHEETEAGHEPTLIDIQQILGQNVAVTVTQRDGTTRVFNGIVNQFSQGHRDERFSYYYATVVPKIWLLTQNSQSRIFQHLTVPDILKKVFESFEVEWKEQGTFKPRNYCVQYRETDFDFASRLMEEEGIYYYFEHSDEKHKMIVANSVQQHLDCPSKNEIPCYVDVTSEEDWIGSIGTWRVDYKLQSGKVTLWDYNFQLPKKKLDAEQPSLVKAGGNELLEIYEYPAGYARKYDGIDKGGGEQAASLQHVFDDRVQTAKTRMQELDAQYKTFSGLADCCSLTAGYRFKLFNHPNNEYNAQHTLVSVAHEIEQSPDYISDEENSSSYRNSFRCIANTTPFRPPQVTPKPIVRGSQTAFVVGPAGEEIFTDKYGRVKVQFHWDREGQIDANSSCWVRVSQAWAGNNWGMMFIPRIGMEVVIEFLEGDPDQPIITGCVYNAEAMPPYTLPDEKTKSGVKSDSSKGGQGFNELRFEDKKGSEQVFIHGEKDLDVRIKNDSREYIGNDRHLVVKNDRREKVDRDTHLLVKRDQIEKIERDRHVAVKGKEAIEISGSQSLKVSGSVGEEVGGSKSEQVSGTLYLKGMNVVVEAMTGLTLKVGGNFVNINAAGVQINGTMVNINSGGAPLSGAAAALVSPLIAAIADSADDAKPGSKITLEKRSAARKERTVRENQANQDKKSWIKLKMVDEAGNPVAGESYRIKTSDGRVASGTLNEKGEAEVKGIEPGSCQVTFPNLDKEAWEEA